MLLVPVSGTSVVLEVGKYCNAVRRIHPTAEIAPCTFPSIGYLMRHASGRLFDTDARVQCEVHWWLLGLIPDLYHKGA